MTPAEIVETANQIAKEYAADGLKLTLRQMYYQFVARGLIESGAKPYDRIGYTLTQARYAGTFPIDALEDRGREVRPGSFKVDQTSVVRALGNAESELRNAPTSWLWRSRWWAQPTHVSVWVEKEALAGIFEPVCEDLGVSWFPCKGYPSVSALYSWLKETDEVSRLGRMERAVVLYFGDHDPDGWEIPRSSERNLGRLRELGGFEDYPITFERIALNMNQIRTYSPPPFEAKMTSSRYTGYVEEHETDEAWELDALEPRVLRDMIRREVSARFDRRIYERNRKVVGEARADMRRRMIEPGWIAGALGVVDVDDDDAGDDDTDGGEE